MPTINDIITSATEDDKFLESLASNHQSRLIGSIRSLRDKIHSSLNKLSTTSAGKLEGAKVNLKQSQKIHKRMVQLFESEYNQSVDSILGDFSAIEKTINRRYKDLNVSADFVSIDKDMLDALKSNIYSRYKEFGEDAQNKIAEAMYQSVATGQKQSTLVNAITGILTGKKDVRGRPMTAYAKGFAQDAVMNYQNQVTLAKGERAGFTHFLYFGDVIATSRPFCITRVGKVYTKRQIQAWDSLDWQGKSGSAWTERGGYNCRHQWRPVKKEWLKNEKGEDLERDEVLGFMSAGPDTPELSKNTKRYDYIEKRMIELKEEAKKLKGRKRIGARTLDRLDEIKIEQAALKGELESLRGKIKRGGKVRKPRKKPVVAPKITKHQKEFISKIKYYVKNGRPVGENSKMFGIWNELSDADKLWVIDDWKTQGINVYKKDYPQLFPGGTFKPKRKVKVVRKPKAKKVKLTPRRAATPRLPKPPDVKSVEQQLNDAGINNVWVTENERYNMAALDGFDFAKKDILNETNRLRSDFPGIRRSLDSHESFNVELTPGGILIEDIPYNHVYSDVANGVYADPKFHTAIKDFKQPRISIATRNKYYNELVAGDTIEWDRFERGREWNISDFTRNSPRSIYRHELGHHVHTNMYWDRYNGVSNAYGDWENLWYDFNIINPDTGEVLDNLFKDMVTEYAGTNVQEAFAESFAIYTHRTYQRGWLPKSIEDFMDAYIRGDVLGDVIPEKELSNISKVSKVTNVPPMQAFANKMKGSTWIDYKPDASVDYVRRKGKWYLKGKPVDVKTAKRLDSMAIPPAGKHAVVARDPRAKKMAMWKAANGKTQYRYNADYMAARARQKFERVKSFKRDMPKIRKKIDLGMAKGDERAYILELENRTAIRAGTDRDIGARVKAYGLTTLEKQHVKVRGNKITIDFIAKEGIPAHYELSDAKLAKYLKEKTKNLKKGEKIFSYNAKKINDYIEQLAGKKYSFKDFRTYHGTRIAFEELQQYAGEVYTAKEKKAIVKAVTTKVSEFLHNTPAMAKKAYIDPIVWDIIGGI